VEVANSFAERSVSGNGIHVVGRLKKPRGPNKLLGGRVEVYDSGQFMVLTGDIIGNAPAEVNDIQHVVDDLFRQHRAWFGDFEDTEVVPRC
jgi:primase-polymerase (primpol)-like protein